MDYKIGLSHRYTIDLCRKNPKTLFVFGSNEKGSGLGGQAIIREQINSIGISTKKSIQEYWKDENFEENIKVIEFDIQRVKDYYKSDDFKLLCFPYSGLGTGLAKLHILCPKTFIYLSTRLLDEFGYNNFMGLKTS